MTGIVFIISAPSGAGKTSLINALVQHIGGVSISTSHTTRTKRSCEKNDVQYHFINKKLFLDMVFNNQFLEYAKVFGHYYGTSRAWVMKILASLEDVILEVDWQGAKQIRKKIPETVSIYILPPSKSRLTQQLNDRNQDNQSIIKMRMKQAKQEISHYDDYNYIVINEHFEEAVADLKCIIQANRLSLLSQSVKFKHIISKLQE